MHGLTLAAINAAEERALTLSMLMDFTIWFNTINLG